MAEALLSLLVSADHGRFRIALPRRRKVTIGRAPECDVVLDDGAVSRRHAALHFTPGKIVVEDLASSNGTSVLGRRLARGARAPLPLGATFEVAGTTLLVHESRALAADAPRARAKKSGPVVVDPALLRIYALIDVIAPTALDVLLLGETGCGKRMLAEALVARSPLAKRALVAIDCGTLDAASLARATKEAAGGTILFERVHDLPRELRAKVLGARRRPPADAPRRLYTAYPEGRALAARVGGFTLAVPPLRERREDIVPLARAFAARSAKQLDEPIPELSEQAMNLLTRHEWPRNVRELQGVIERAVIEADGAEWIDLEHLRLPRYE